MGGLCWTVAAWSVWFSWWLLRDCGAGISSQNVLYRERRQRWPAAFFAINLNWSGEVERPWGPRSPRLFLYCLPCLGRQPRQLICGCKAWLFCWARQLLNWPSQWFQVPSPWCLCSGPPVWGVMAACCFPVLPPRALWNSELWCIGLLHSLWNIVLEFTEVINCNDQQPRTKGPLDPPVEVFECLKLWLLLGGMPLLINWRLVKERHCFSVKISGQKVLKVIVHPKSCIYNSPSCCF